MDVSELELILMFKINFLAQTDEQQCVSANRLCRRYRTSARVHQQVCEVRRLQSQLGRAGAR